MARILICEPDPALRELVAVVAAGLGHEPRFHDPAAPASGPTADLLIVEPAAEGALECARAFRLAQPGLTILCISNRSAGPEVRELEPVDYIVKPFTLAQLEQAIARALMN